MRSRWATKRTRPSRSAAPTTCPRTLSPVTTPSWRSNSASSSRTSRGVQRHDAVRPARVPPRPGRDGRRHHRRVLRLAGQRGVQHPRRDGCARAIPFASTRSSWKPSTVCSSRFAEEALDVFETGADIYSTLRDIKLRGRWSSRTLTTRQPRRLQRDRARRIIVAFDTIETPPLNLRSYGYQAAYGEFTGWVSVIDNGDVSYQLNVCSLVWS